MNKTATPAPPAPEPVSSLGEALTAVALRPPAAEANGQLIVALAIVVTMGVLGLALVIAGCVTKQWAVAMGGIGPIVGSLATALNAPTGIANAVRASKAPSHG